MTHLQLQILFRLKILILAGEQGDGGQTHWVKRSSLVDSRTSVTDVKFAPKHLGLQLVSIFIGINGFLMLLQFLQHVRNFCHHSTGRISYFLASTTVVPQGLEYLLVRR